MGLKCVRLRGATETFSGASLVSTAPKLCIVSFVLCLSFSVCSCC